MDISELHINEEDRLINLPHAICFRCNGGQRYGRCRIRENRIGVSKVYGVEEVLSMVLKQSY